MAQIETTTIDSAELAEAVAAAGYPRREVTWLTVDGEPAAAVIPAEAARRLFTVPGRCAAGDHSLCLLPDPDTGCPGWQPPGEQPYAYAIQAGDGDAWPGHLGEVDRAGWSMSAGTAAEFAAQILDGYLDDVAHDAEVPRGQPGSEPCTPLRVIVWHGEEPGPLSAAAVIYYYRPGQQPPPLPLFECAWCAQPCGPAGCPCGSTAVRLAGTQKLTGTEAWVLGALAGLARRGEHHATVHDIAGTGDETPEDVAAALIRLAYRRYVRTADPVGYQLTPAGLAAARLREGGGSGE